MSTESNQPTTPPPSFVKLAMRNMVPVSYTHLTLPTILLV